MESSKFWTFIFLVCLVAGIFSAVQYFQSVDAANAQVVEARSKLNQTRETLKLRQTEWAQIGALLTRSQAAAAKESPLAAKRDELQTRFRRLEGEFKYLVQSMRAAAEKVRADSEGMEFSEVKLANGKVLKNAKVKKFEPQELSFLHSDGFLSVAFDLLPADILERFDLGESGLASQLENKERALFNKSK